MDALEIEKRVKCILNIDKTNLSLDNKNALIEDLNQVFSQYLINPTKPEVEICAIENEYLITVKLTAKHLRNYK